MLTPCIQFAKARMICVCISGGREWLQGSIGVWGGYSGPFSWVTWSSLGSFRSAPRIPGGTSRRVGCTSPPGRCPPRIHLRSPRPAGRSGGICAADSPHARECGVSVFGPCYSGRAARELEEAREQFPATVDRLPSDDLRVPGVRGVTDSCGAGSAKIRRRVSHPELTASMPPEGRRAGPRGGAVWPCPGHGAF